MTFTATTTSMALSGAAGINEDVRGIVHDLSVVEATPFAASPTASPRVARSEVWRRK